MLISFHFGDSCGHFHRRCPSATCAVSKGSGELAMCALTWASGSDAGLRPCQTGVEVREREGICEGPLF